MSNMRVATLRRRLPIRSGTVLIAAALFPAIAEADCNADIAALMNKRMASIAVLNQNTKSHGGKLDPVAACPQLQNLAAVEGSVVAYMNKNKDWCSIPDDMIGKMSESQAKSRSLAGKACNFVVQMKKMQAQQARQAQAGAAAAAQQQAVKLPAGPL